MRRDVFNAIADPTRREILMSLTKEKRNVNALAEQFDMTRQAVSPCEIPSGMRGHQH